jgi:hypothetical protein
LNIIEHKGALDVALNKTRLRKLHFALAPIITLPLLLTIFTGIGFQMAIASGKGSEFIWLLDLHRGKFGSVNLEMVYPILNGLSLLTMVITGLLMWFTLPNRPQKNRQP